MEMDRDDYELLIAQTEEGFELLGLTSYFERKGFKTYEASIKAIELQDRFRSIVDEALL